MFEGPEPVVFIAQDEAQEIERVAAFLAESVADGVLPAEIGVFVRSPAQLDRARAAALAADLPTRSFIDKVAQNVALIGTMHLAKGLEFKCVAVMACDAGVLPLDERIADVADEFELDEVIATERQLLYVAATRARDRLLVSGVEPASELLEELARRA